MATLSQCMGSRALQPCHGAGLAAQWAWLKGAAPPVSHHEGAWGFGCWQSALHEGVNEERRRRKKTLSLPLLLVQGKKKGE